MQGTINPEDRKWLETEIIPVAVKNGLKNIASVVREDIFKKFYLEQIKASLEVDNKAFLKMFSNVEDALKWIKEI